MDPDGFIRFGGSTMINAIAVESVLSAPKARSTAVGQSFSKVLTAAQSAPPSTQESQPVNQAPSLTLPQLLTPTAQAEQLTASERLQSLGEARGDILRSVFKLIEEATGQPITESVGFRRSGDHFQVYSVRQRSDGAEDGPAFGHPQGELLESVLNGTDPELAELTKKVKALLEKADSLLPAMNDARRDFALAWGQEPPEPLAAGDEVWCISLPIRFAESGRRMAEGAPTDFANFRATLTPDDLGRLSEEQIYSRYFVSRANKEQIAAAIKDEERAKAAEA